MTTRSMLLVFVLLASVVSGCGDEGEPAGAPSFVSADGARGQRAVGPPERDAGFDTDGPPERTIEEGDIYRLLDATTLINLNTYRGLQVIDLSDLQHPRVVGRLPITGGPVEMYVIGSRAVVLLNGWSGYYGTRDDVRVERVEGGLVLSIDLADRTGPTELDREIVPGFIQTSRLAREGEQAALYVAATRYDEIVDGTTRSWEPRTYVKSFDVSLPDFAEQSALELGGSVSDIQATPEAMIVARDDWTSGSEGSRVSLIDIANPSGEMSLGGEVRVSGRVASQFNMDLHAGVLRVVSAGAFSGGRTNHLETFDAHSLATLAPLDHCTFGAGEDLYATLFVDNRAFFVTYMRVDPFHAFEIGDDGSCTEHSEFVVSGWNDFFRAALDTTRLIGIGVDDADGRRTAAVSVYDITDLTNATPLLARASVGTDNSWSEANWDHRAFSVIEDAVSVTASNGTPETGLVLLPFSGWREADEEYQAAVQIFTFSATTLTRRGVMEHGSPVRRSFLFDSGTAANLSDFELALYDTQAPDAPALLGSVDLAPSYTRVLRFGEHTVRLEDSSWTYGWWGSRGEQPSSRVQVIAPGADPDMAEAIAELEVPQGAQLYQVGSLLVSVMSVPRDLTIWPYEWDTTVEVLDLQDPAHPMEVGELSTDRIRPHYASWAWTEPALAPDCLGCRGGYYFPGRYDDLVRVVDDAIVFTRVAEESEVLGSEHVCVTYPNVAMPCSSDDDTCTYYTGGITCRSLDGAADLCEGSIARCTFARSPEESYECVEIDPSEVETSESCYDHELRRYWQRFTLDVLDLSNPSAPRLADAIELPRIDEAVGLVGGARRVFYTYRQPATVSDDPRPYVAWYFRPIELGSPGEPVLGPAVNVPGELVAVDGTALVTEDLVWGARIAETVVRRLEWAGPERAELVASHTVEGRAVDSLVLDGSGHILLSHRAPWSLGYGYDVAVSDAAYSPYIEDEPTRLRILDQTDLGQLSDVEIDSWATLEQAASGRALFQVPGGLLLVSLSDAASPAAQAYFPTLGWPSEVFFEGDEILFAAGPYGIHRFDANETNLIPTSWARQIRNVPRLPFTTTVR
jgi:hypothetical protein